MVEYDNFLIYELRHCILSTDAPISRTDRVRLFCEDRENTQNVHYSMTKRNITKTSSLWMDTGPATKLNIEQSCAIPVLGQDLRNQDHM